MGGTLSLGRKSHTASLLEQAPWRHDEGATQSFTLYTRMAKVHPAALEAVACVNGRVIYPFDRLMPLWLQDVAWVSTPRLQHQLNASAQGGIASATLRTIH